jgi:hypothetical protein
MPTSLFFDLKTNLITGEGSDQESRQRWPALESNPEILSNFLIGVGVPPAYSFVDVYGLDEDMLAMVPQVSFLSYFRTISPASLR